MKEVKNINQLFQEKFQDLQVTPSEDVWNSIEIELKKKKSKRRVIPFWWKLSGVAAVFVIGLSIFNSNNSSPNTKIESENTVVDNDKKKSKKDEVTVKVDEVTNNDSKVATKEIYTSTNEQVKLSKGNNNEQKNVSNVANYKNDTNSNHSIKNTTYYSKNLVNNSTVNSKKETVERIVITYNDDTKNEELNVELIKNGNEQVVTISKENDKIAIIKEEKTVAINNDKNNVSNNSLLKEYNIEKDKIAMKNLDNIVLKGDPIKKDSLPIASNELLAMEELQKEKEKKVVNEQKMNRWQVAPNLAPIYLSSFSNDSPLDKSLNSNEKVYNSNISYGVNVSYAINKKVKVRTGFNSFIVDYDTRNIVFFQDQNAQMMRNIKPTIQGAMMQIMPLQNVAPSNLNKVVSERFDGVLNQKMGYYELPLEMAYSISNKKIGLEIIGGFSSLFLNTNEVFLKADGLKMKVGSVTNLNELHFSTNIGLGFNYELFKNVKAHFDPSFKYQINTFSNNYESFNPYIFGVYSGISYTF